MGAAGGRILIVDDDPELRAFVCALLSGRGYEVAAVGDAEAAHALLCNESSRPELILLDLAMPGTNGFDLLTILRAEPELLELPALVISGFARRDYAAACLERGADDYITKPVDSRELLARVGTHLRRAQERREWRMRSYTDPLTNLLNRRAFVDRLEQEVHRAGRDSCALALVFMDVDSFKQINDEWGHVAGDMVLRLVAEEVTGALRRCDIAARWGGDEFVVALPGANYRAAASAAERVRRSVSARSSLALPGPVRISVGVSCLDADVSTFDRAIAMRLVDASDRAMYADKRRNDLRRLAEGTEPRVRHELRPHR